MIQEEFIVLIENLKKYYPTRFDKDRCNQIWRMVKHISAEEFKKFLDKRIWDSKTDLFAAKFDDHLAKFTYKYRKQYQEQKVTQLQTCTKCDNGFIDKFRYDLPYVFRCDCILGNQKSEEIPKWMDQYGYYDKRKSNRESNTKLFVSSKLHKMLEK